MATTENPLNPLGYPISGWPAADPRYATWNRHPEAWPVPGLDPYQGALTRYVEPAGYPYYFDHPFDPRAASLPIPGVTSGLLPSGMNYDYLPSGTPIVLPIATNAQQQQQLLDAQAHGLLGPSFDGVVPGGAGAAAGGVVGPGGIPLGSSGLGASGAAGAAGAGGNPFGTSGLGASGAAGAAGAGGNPFGNSGLGASGAAGAAGAAGAGGNPFGNSGLGASGAPGAAGAGGNPFGNSGLGASGAPGAPGGPCGPGGCGAGLGPGGAGVLGACGGPGGANAADSPYVGGGTQGMLKNGIAVRIGGMMDTTTSKFDGLIGDIVGSSFPQEGGVNYSVRCPLWGDEEVSTHKEIHDPYSSIAVSKKAQDAWLFNREKLYPGSQARYEASRMPDPMEGQILAEPFQLGGEHRYVGFLARSQINSDFYDKFTMEGTPEDRTPPYIVLNLPESRLQPLTRSGVGKLPGIPPFAQRR